MLAKTGLLVVSNPKRIGTILPSVQKKVKTTLYIQLLSALGDPFANIFASWPKYSQTIHGIYSQAAHHCRNLDVRVLLSGLKYKDLTRINTQSIVDLVIFDKSYNKNDIDSFVKTKVNLSEKFDVLTLDSGDFERFDGGDDGKVYDHAVLGGTFDRLHTAHKLLLSEAVLRSRKRVTVGVTEEVMLKGKLLWELIEDIEVRINNVKSFLEDVCPELIYRVVPISDPFGPSIVDPSMEMIVVSDETIKGGRKINEIRLEKNLSQLDILPIELIEDPNHTDHEESKISSSSTRIRLLGTLLKPPRKKPSKPYVIGLTGGVASGKSGVAKWLHQCGAEIVNCDLIGHDVYKPGKPCHEKIVSHFGNRVLTPQGEIDRKVLGSIVFNDPEEMKQLNALVWPGIGAEVEGIIRASESGVIVVEAAVLSVAGWQRMCHEVWTTLVPRAEAVERLMTRNNLTEDQACARIDSQPSNKIYVDNANVVFSTLWEEEFTKKQVEKAWQLLQERL